MCTWGIEENGRYFCLGIFRSLFEGFTHKTEIEEI